MLFEIVGVDFCSVTEALHEIYFLTCYFINRDENHCQRENGTKKFDGILKYFKSLDVRDKSPNKLSKQPVHSKSPLIPQRKGMSFNKRK